MNGIRRIEIRPIQVGEDSAPPRLQSYLLWKYIFDGYVDQYEWLPRMLRQNGYTFPGTRYQLLHAQEKLYGNDWCNLCGGIGTREDEYGYYYCLCHLLQMRDDLIKRASPWISEKREHKTLNSIEFVGSNIGQINSLKDTVAYLKKWMFTLDKHIVLSGPTGVGKTHMLNAILTEWYPWFVPIVSSDFERLLRANVSENGGSNISKMMSVWMNHPGLIIDDLGMEYATTWITQKLEDLIEHRTRKTHWWDTITVVATNLRKSEVKQKFTRDGVSRIGSRLTDTETVAWLGIDAMDYRNRKR